MTIGKKVAVIIGGGVAALAVVVAVYFFLPTAPKTIEGAWVSEDGLLVDTYQGGTVRGFMEATYGENATPDETFKYSVTDNMMRISEGKEASGNGVSLLPITLAMKFSEGNRVVTLYDGDQRVNSMYRVGSPEASLIHFSNNWFK